MSAYIVTDLDVHDAAGLEEYRKQVTATITTYGGRYLVRGGKFETLEGNWHPKRLVVLEFPSGEQARGILPALCRARTTRLRPDGDLL